MPDPKTTSPLTAENPWRGAAPYTEDDRAFFFGRRREIDELRHLLLRDTLTVLVGIAGTGKTSLVRAGLLPSLSPDWLPVPIAIDWTAATEQRPLNQQVLEAIDAAALARPLVGPAFKPTDTLWEAFHRTGARWWNARQRVVTPVLVFDQLENAFTAGDTDAKTRRHRDRFLEELAQLVSNRPPSRVASRIEDGSEADDAFDFRPAPVRVVLVVREEATGLLARLRDLFPTFGRSELRLTPFTEAQAREALTRPASQRGLFADGVIDQLLPRLATGHDHEHPFPPAALSTQARGLAETRAQRNAAQIAADFFLPAQPAVASSPATGVAKIEPAADVAAPSAPARKRRSSAPLRLAAIIAVCAAAWFVWQQQQPKIPQPIADSTIEEAGPPATPVVAEPTATPAPPTATEATPRIALIAETPTPSPAPPMVAALPPSTPTPTPPPTTPSPIPATPTPPPPPATPTPAPATPTPAPTPLPPPPPPPPPESTPVPPPPPASAAPSSAIKPSTPRRASASPRPRERAKRPESPRRPATSTIVTPPPPRPTPAKRRAPDPIRS